ncbi:MAG: hypothetical protein ABIE70_09780 [bacterium]
MAIHRHKPQYTNDLIASMRRFALAMTGQPGFQRAFSLSDELSGALIGLAFWDSKEACKAAMEAAQTAIADELFDQWEDAPPEVFRLIPNFEITAD